MGKINLTRHRKFRRLARALGSPALALGTLELLWLSAYEAADPYVGEADDVADAVTWAGDPLELVAHLEAAGFLDRAGPGYTVHDLWDHVPKYVRLRWTRAHKDAPPEARPWHQSSSGVTQTGTGDPVIGLLPVPARPGPARDPERAAAKTPPAPALCGKPVEVNPRVVTRLAYELPEREDEDEADKKADLKDLAVRHGVAFDASSITGALDHRARTATRPARRAAMRRSV